MKMVIALVLVLALACGFGGCGGGGDNGVILLVSDRGTVGEETKWDIYSVRPDGRGLKNLTNFGDVVLNFEVSPDGSKIAFTRGESYPREGALWVMDRDGGNKRLLCENYDAGRPRWSPDSSKLAYHYEGNIYVVDTDGTDPVNLTSEFESPAYRSFWSPDSSKIAFWVEIGLPDFATYVIGADGSGLTPLVEGYMRDYPCWSPDSTKLAYRMRHDSSDDLYVIDANGENELQLTDSGVVTDLLLWSPNSQKILYGHSNDADFPTSDNEIWVTNADGGSKKRLAEDSSWATQRVLWTPDGSNIAYISYDHSADGLREKSRLILMNPDSGDKTVMVEEGADGPLNYLQQSQDEKRLMCYGADHCYSISCDGTDLITFDMEVDGVRMKCMRWSPDGKSLLCREWAVIHAYNLYVMTTSGITNITNDPDNIYEDYLGGWVP